MSDDTWEPRPGQMHRVDQAFYDLTIKELDYERVKNDRLAVQILELEATLKSIREEAQEILAEHREVWTKNLALRMHRFTSFTDAERAVLHDGLMAEADLEPSEDPTFPAIIEVAEKLLDELDWKKT